MPKSTQIINEMTARSLRPIENKAAIKRALKFGETLTFFNWECPPRTLTKTGDGRSAIVNYDVDLEKIFRGELIDDFTELPRVVADAEDEKATLAWLQSLGIPFRFVKLVADTNAYYLTPESIKEIGEATIEARFEEFAERINNRLQDYPAKAKVIRFTNLIRDYQTLYDTTYNKALTSLQSDPTSLLPPGVFEAQIERTKEHMGMTDMTQIKDFAAKTIASYAAEGMVFAKLTTTPDFLNCIWLNNHEVDDRTVAITNCYRTLKGIEALPMVFID